MKKESVRLLSLFLFSIILISFIASSVIAPDSTDASQPIVDEQQNQQTVKSSTQTLSSDLKNWLTNTTLNNNTEFISDQTKNLISKLLLMILVIIIIYSIASFLPFIPQDKDYINWLIAAIVGILSFMFVSKENIDYIIVTYEALGIMLTSLLPLIAILVITYKLRERYGDIASIVNPALIVGFLIYIGIKWIKMTPSLSQFSSWPELAYVYPATFIITVVWLVLEKRISKWIFKKAMLGSIDKFRNMEMEVTAAEINKLRDLLEYAQPEYANLIKERIKNLENLMPNR